jgi:hypothetical protein
MMEMSENRQARLEKVEGFMASSPEDLANELNAWLADANEKVILQRDFLYDTGVYACFIVFTE